MLALVRRLLPLLVAVCALAYVGWQTDFPKLQVALARAPLVALLAISAGMAVLNCAADTLAMFYVFRGFGLHLRFFDLYTIRAATYTLAVINYHVGQLGIVGYLHRAGRVPLARASAYILFIVGIWVALLLVFASGGLFLGGPVARMVAPLLGLFLLGIVVYALLRRWPPRFLVHEPPLSPLGKLWEPLMGVGFKGHLRAMVVRLPHLAILIVWHFIGLRCFDVQVPFLASVLYLPVVFAMASLSFLGLGTSQAAATYCFTQFAAGGKESVLAYSLSMTAISTACNLIMGLLFLRRGARLGLADMVESAARGFDSSPDAEPAGSGGPTAG